MRAALSFRSREISLQVTLWWHHGNTIRAHGHRAAEKLYFSKNTCWSHLPSAYNLLINLSVFVAAWLIRSRDSLYLQANPKTPLQINRELWLLSPPISRCLFRLRLHRRDSDVFSVVSNECRCLQEREWYKSSRSKEAVTIQHTQDAIRRGWSHPSNWE